MACKKSELVAAINSFASARLSNDPNLIGFAMQLLEQQVESLEYAPEEEEEAEAPAEG